MQVNLFLKNKLTFLFQKGRRLCLKSERRNASEAQGLAAPAAMVLLIFTTANAGGRMLQPYPMNFL